MVSHDIKEVVYMADRIVIFGANPGRILKIIDNTLPRPRDYRSPGFLQLVDHIHDIIGQAELETIAAKYKQTAGFDRATVSQAAERSATR